jgi:hypothetical protein
MSGLCFFVFNIYLLLARTLLALLHGDHALIHAIAAAPSVKEEGMDSARQAREAAGTGAIAERGKAPC